MSSSSPRKSAVGICFVSFVYIAPDRSSPPAVAQSTFKRQPDPCRPFVLCFGCCYEVVTSKLYRSDDSAKPDSASAQRKLLT